MDPNLLTQMTNALNKEDKLRIINLIFTRGKKSITDVRKELNLNFSTTHKYLNQLEKAGILVSEQTKEGGRRKKLYSVKNFDLRLSPENIVSAVQGRKEKKTKELGKEFNMLTWEGLLTKFNVQKLKDEFTSFGIPANVVKRVFEKLDEIVFDGITVEQLRTELFNELDNQISSLEFTKNKLDEIEILRQRRNLLDVLKEKGLDDIVKSHREGDITIRSIGKFYPLTIHHHFYLVLKHGLNIIGIDASPAKYFDSAVAHLRTVTEAVQKNISNNVQSFDSLNVFLAPFISDLSKLDVKQNAQMIIYSLDQLHKINDMYPMINLETKIPKHLSKLPAIVGGKEVGILADYESEAHNLFNAFIDTFLESEKLWPKITVKIRDEPPENFDEFFDKVYIANMKPKWQTENSSYSVDWGRLDSSWKDWEKSLGTGTLQMVLPNLPRIGYETNDETKMFEKLGKILEHIKKCFVVSMENSTSKLFTEMPYLSKTIRRDKFYHLDDCVCTLGISSLTDLTESMGENSSKDPKLALKIVDFINKNLDLKEYSIRTGIQESDFTPYLERFTQLDKRKYGSKVAKKYIGGVQISNQSNDEKIEYHAKFQKKLGAGHMCYFDNLNIETAHQALKSQIGAFGNKEYIFVV